MGEGWCLTDPTKGSVEVAVTQWIKTGLYSQACRHRDFSGRFEKAISSVWLLEKHAQ